MLTVILTNNGNTKCIDNLIVDVTQFLVCLYCLTLLVFFANVFLVEKNVLSGLIFELAGMVFSGD